jgi:dipeptidyl aminopeptidase/acylaminoacyl peptidase
VQRSSTLVVLAACALLTSCSPTYDNPFTANVALPPPDSARVVFVSNLWAARAGAPREAFSVDDNGAHPTRLTFCNGDQRQCDNVEISPSPDRRRVVMGRIQRDANNDGRLTAADGEALVFLDLARGTEAVITADTEKVSGLDWSPAGDVVVYTATGVGGVDDFWRVDPNGENRRNLTVSPGIRERRPRIDPSGMVALFERLDPANGKSQIYIFATTVSQTKVTEGGPGTDVLPGSLYTVGSDTDPDYSPDGRSAVFRRLTGLGSGGAGNWDIVTVRTDGTGLVTVASGPAYRGAPDWGPDGRILFTESDSTSTRLVVIRPDGSDRRVLVTVGSTLDISSPRWLP